MRYSLCSSTAFRGENENKPSPGCTRTLSIKRVKRMDKIDKQIAKSKTMCCKAEWYRKSRANFRCKKCERDVTLEIMLLYKALTE